MNKESAGAFIDAVYAIAVTILALEVPGELNSEFTSAQFGLMLLEYSIAFVLLFAFWLQHRRINGQIGAYGRATIWLTGAALLLVCLLPRATTLVFAYGEDVTLYDIKQSWISGQWTIAEMVDLFYVGLVLTADLILLTLASICTAGQSSVSAQVVRRSKMTTTLIVAAMLGASFLMPVQNRYFLLFIPIALFFERELLQLIFKQDKDAVEAG
jgi:uncharacterized membrane protein